jgi:hypothetical protein
MRFVNIRRIFYNVSQRKQVKCSEVRSETARNKPGVSILYNNKNEKSKT